MSNDVKMEPSHCAAPALRRRAWSEYLPGARARALHRRASLGAYLAAISAGKNVTSAIRAAQVVYYARTGKTISTKTVFRLRDSMPAALEFLAVPLVEFTDFKSCPHPNARLAAKKAKASAQRAGSAKP